MSLEGGARGETGEGAGSADDNALTFVHKGINEDIKVAAGTTEQLRLPVCVCVCEPSEGEGRGVREDRRSTNAQTVFFPFFWGWLIIEHGLCYLKRLAFFCLTHSVSGRLVLGVCVCVCVWVCVCVCVCLLRCSPLYRLL